MCIVNEDLVDSHGHAGDAFSPVGWIEKDGKQADFPTHESEKVYVGDAIDVHVEVHITPCYSWYVCLSVCLSVSLGVYLPQDLDRDCWAATATGV